MARSSVLQGPPGARGGGRARGRQRTAGGAQHGARREAAKRQLPRFADPLGRDGPVAPVGFGVHVLGFEENGRQQQRPSDRHAAERLPLPFAGGRDGRQQGREQGRWAPSVPYTPLTPPTNSLVFVAAEYRSHIEHTQCYRYYLR